MIKRFVILYSFKIQMSKKNLVNLTGISLYMNKENWINTNTFNIIFKQMYFYYIVIIMHYIPNPKVFIKLTDFRLDSFIF